MNEIIKTSLKTKGMSQKELAEKLYVTPQAVSKWVSGESQPTLDNVKLMGEIFGQDFMQKCFMKGYKRQTTMKREHCKLEELDNIKKAQEEARLIVESAGGDKYSHATYTLLNWLLTAVIGLTYHRYINHKEEPLYENVFSNLNDYFNRDFEYSKEYENSLDFSFYLMGGDLFESFGEYTIPNHEYAGAVLDLWFSFKKTIANSSLRDELKIAIMDIVLNN